MHGHKNEDQGLFISDTPWVLRSSIFHRAKVGHVGDVPVLLSSSTDTRCARVSKRLRRVADYVGRTSQRHAFDGWMGMEE